METDTRETGLTKYYFVIFLFEIIICAVHYYVLHDVLSKTADLDDFVAHGISILWGLGASMVPIILYLSLFYFSDLRNVVKKRIDSQKGKITEVSDKYIVAEKLKDRIPFYSIFILCVLGIIFFTEAYTFYMLVHDSSGSLFSTNVVEKFDFGSYFIGLVASIMHHVITSAIMFWFSIATASNVYTYLAYKLEEK